MIDTMESKKIIYFILKKKSTKLVSFMFGLKADSVCGNLICANR